MQALLADLAASPAGQLQAARGQAILLESFLESVEAQPMASASIAQASAAALCLCNTAFAERGAAGLPRARIYTQPCPLVVEKQLLPILEIQIHWIAMDKVRPYCVAISASAGHCIHWIGAALCAL